jgi:hypothetical protein
MLRQADHFRRAVFNQQSDQTQADRIGARFKPLRINTEGWQCLEPNADTELHILPAFGLEVGALLSFNPISKMKVSTGD